MSTRILVIEDDPINLELMDFLLRTVGYVPSLARDGVEGLAVARRDRPDLIVSDILMPNMDGYEVARRIRSDPELCRTPLLAVTALAMAGDREKIIEAGFDGYISKPLNIQNFVAQIRAFLER